MKTRIKICGLRRKEDIDGVNEASPDYCGFILNVPASRRSIDPEQLGMLMEDLDPAVVPTGVFVNEETETILRIVRGEAHPDGTASWTGKRRDDPGKSSRRQESRSSRPFP